MPRPRTGPEGRTPPDRVAADPPSDHDTGPDGAAPRRVVRPSAARTRPDPAPETAPDTAAGPATDAAPAPATLSAPVTWTGRESGLEPAAPAGPVADHWPRAAERRAAARQPPCSSSDRTASQRADDEQAALLATARRAAATRDATNRAARRTAARYSTRGRIRRFRAPVAAALLGVAVVAATGTADARVESPRSLFEPRAVPPADVRPGPGPAPPVTAAPATTTVPSTPDPVPPSTAAPDARPGPPGVRPASVATALPDARARSAIRVAMSQIGLPYVWGGDGPRAGDAGFDCSGLTHFAYGEAGIELPRTAHTQFRAGPRVPQGEPLQPGDLVFYGTYRKVHHVGLYIGDGRMVNAPTFGLPVQTAWYRWSGDDYIGATRPASSEHGSAPLTDVPEVPDPVEPPARDEFLAPVAPRPTAVPEPREPQPREPDSAARSRAGSDAEIAAGRAPAPPATPQARPITRRPAMPGTAPDATAAGGPVPSTSVTVAAPPGVAPGATAPAPATAGPRPPSRPATAHPRAAGPPAPAGPAVPPGVAARVGPPPATTTTHRADGTTPSGGPHPPEATPPPGATPRPGGVTTPPAPPQHSPGAPAASRPNHPEASPQVAAAPEPVSTGPATASPRSAPPPAPTRPPAPAVPSPTAHPGPTPPAGTPSTPAAPAAGHAPAADQPPTEAHPPAAVPPRVSSTSSPAPTTRPPAPARATTPGTPPPVTPRPSSARPSPAATSTSPATPNTTSPLATTSDVDRLLVVGGTRVPVAPVDEGSGGLPEGPGVARGAAGWIVQVRAPLAAAPGTRVTLHLPDGRTLRWTVASRSAPGPRTAAAASDAPLTLIVPAGRGRWVVVTAR